MLLCAVNIALVLISQIMLRITGYIFLLFFAVLIASCAPKRHAVSASDGRFIGLHDSLKLEHAESSRLISPYKARLDSTMNAVVGYTDVELVKPKEYQANNGKPESPMGNFVADLILLECNELLKEKNEGFADICLLNTGGIRSSLPKGAITIGHIFEIMPFDNNIVVIELNGGQMTELFDLVALKGGHPLAGCSMAIKNKHAADIKLAGTPFDAAKDRLYRVATSDYLATGGDNMTFFAKGNLVAELPMFRDIIIKHFEKLTIQGKHAFAEADGRVYYDK